MSATPDHPYRTPSAPAARRRLMGQGVLGLLLLLAVLHVAFFAAFLVLTPFLRWVGPNGFLGISVRLVASLAGFVVVVALLSVALPALGGRRGRNAAIAIAAIYLIAAFAFMDRDRTYFLFLRFGSLHLEGVNVLGSLRSSIMNLGLDVSLTAVLAMASLSRQAHREHARGIIANQRPCPNCAREWRIEGDLKICNGCGAEERAPTDEEVSEVLGPGAPEGERFHL